MIYLYLYLAAGFGAAVQWLLCQQVIGRTPIRWRTPLLTLIAWPLDLAAVVAMTCSPRVKAQARENLRQPGVSLPLNLTDK